MTRSQFAPSPTRVEDIRLFTLPRGGTDRLNFKVFDTVSLLALATDTVELTGTFTVKRHDPSNSDWAKGTIDVDMIDLDLHGKSKLLGAVRARLNPEQETVGRVEAAGAAARATKCRFQAFIVLELLDHKLSVFNKEPVLLTHSITHIPPIGQGGGTAGRVALKLFNLARPSQKLAVLREVITEIGDFAKH